MSFPIDIVIPVFNAAEHARRCIESVLAHDHADCRITMIDDASTEPDVARLFADLEQRNLRELVLLRNERNLGFTATANRGIAGSSADVILLNSDTIVAGDWIGGLRQCAASDPRIGTITPFSNNAEICSFPRFCIDNRITDAAEAEATAAAIARSAVPTYPDLPTGVGFCLFVRRALIDQIGMLDPVFGIGYGEENDLCLRAARAGWRNVLADNAFVVHVGGQSFVGQKADLSPRNTAILLERHPHYTRMVEQYIKADPLKALREAAESELTRSQSGARGILHVIHDHGGGTETHVRALIDSSRKRWRHYLAIAVGDAWQIEEHRSDGRVMTFNLARKPDEQWDQFVAQICATFGIALIHLHNISGSREAFFNALPRLGIPYGYTVHDLNFACPTITFLDANQMFCGAVTDVDQCKRCLAAQPEHANIDIVRWRERHHRLLEQAAFLIAPSRWAAETLVRYFPVQSVRLIEHGTAGVTDPSTNPPPSSLALPDDGVPTVALLGAIGPDKGARRIERLVELTRKRNALVRFVLIGYQDVQHGPWQSEDARFTVHGRYRNEELPALLAHYRVTLVLYPSAGPETFSYTLSEAWAAGIPVLVPPIGALAERVEGSGAGWIMTDAQWRDEESMLDRIVALLDGENRCDLEAAARRARDVPHASLTEMADATFDAYEHALENVIARASFRPFARARVRDALGYRPWMPPSIAEPVHVASSVKRRESGDVVTRVAQAALAIRHTVLGRTLYRVTPRPLLDVLKARLKT